MITVMESSHPHHPVQQTRSRRTLDALLDAAEHLLEQKSYSEISLTELVGAAGVTTGAFYSRFESKNDLLVSLHQRYLVWLRNMVDDQLDPSEWRGLSLRARADLAADLVCRLFETRRGLLRAMVIFTRQDSEASVPSDNKHGETPPPQLLLIQNLCDRLDESLAPEERPARDELEFAVYSAITLARESILFPGLPMARALGLDPPRLRARLARLLEFTLSRIGSDRT
jgi:AcrR family transcriptional regulator